MPYNAGPSGVGSGLDFLASFIAGRQQQQQTNQQTAMQQQEANARMAALHAQLQMQQQEMQQRNQQMDLDKQRFGLEQKRANVEQRAAGIDPTTGQPFHYQQSNEATSPKSSPAHRAVILRAMANQAIQNGDTKSAAAFEAQAKDLDAAQAKAQQEALQYAQFAEKRLQDAAQRAHMGNQDAAASARISVSMAALQERIRKDTADIANQSLTRQQADERLAISMKNLGMRAEGLSLQKKHFSLENKRFNLEQQNVQSEIGSRDTARIQSAVSRLHAQGIQLPQDDPAIGEELKDFANANPQGRAFMLSPQAKSIPDSTKAYLNAINALLP